MEQGVCVRETETETEVRFRDREKVREYGKEPRGPGAGRVTVRDARGLVCVPGGVRPQRGDFRRTHSCMKDRGEVCGQIMQMKGVEHKV